MCVMYVTDVEYGACEVYGVFVEYEVWKVEHN